MSYEPLDKLFYKDASSDRFSINKSLANERLNADSTFRTGIIGEAGEFFLAVPRELSILNSRILQRERDVSEALDKLPLIASGALVRSLVIDEVVSTNELEGIHSTRRQISDLLDSPPLSKGVLAEKRFKELANIYLELSDEAHLTPSTPQDIRSIYDRIMHGENLGNDAPDGTYFRRGGVDIIGEGGKILHSGLAPEAKIIAAIGEMIALASSDDIPPTYSAILAHFMFEYIHPFYDGNGRTGRYLLAMYLTRSLSTLTALSLSRTIAENKAGYYRAFRAAESKLNHGELTFFVMGIMKYIAEAQERIIGELQVKRARFEVMLKSIDSLEYEGNYKKEELEILFMLAQYQLFGAFPDMPLATIVSNMEAGKQTVRARLKRLEEKGLVEVVAPRPLCFALSREGIDVCGIGEA